MYCAAISTSSLPACVEWDWLSVCACQAKFVFYDHAGGSWMYLPSVTTEAGDLPNLRCSLWPGQWVIFSWALMFEAYNKRDPGWAPFFATYPPHPAVPSWSWEALCNVPLMNSHGKGIQPNKKKSCAQRPLLCFFWVCGLSYRRLTPKGKTTKSRLSAVFELFFFRMRVMLCILRTERSPEA